ncbi:hypothetical protein KY346_04535 [Candidatus Woesearchaeota archaeon]|nr:hypothetical protein [Candidatus Woesearchaeota archaeon]
MQNTPIIQIWNAFEPINIEPDNGNKFKIEVRSPEKELPEELERKVDENWRRFCIRNSHVKGGKIIYLREPVASGREPITAVTEERHFKYTQAFNRDEILSNPTEILRKYRLLSISTHCHLVTKDDKILFGTKKNQSNQISGFSGFPDTNEDTVEVDGKKYLKIYQTMLNRLRSEIGYLVDAIDSINAVGITYVNIPRLRGLDFNYVVRLDEKAENVKQRFQETWQFEKELFVADFEPEKMVEFVKDIHKDKMMSRYALGCMYLEIKAFFGEKEAEKLRKTIQEDIGVSMSTENETGYFS